MLTLLLALQVSAPPMRAAETDSSLRARVDSAILQFQREWRDAWQSSRVQLDASAGIDRGNETRLRVLAMHCHWRETSPLVQRYVIAGSVPSHATCPIWYPEDAPRVADERHGIDGALTLTRRWRVRQLRFGVRALLDTAARQLPGDARIAAQRLRFALDDGDAPAAIEAAASCAAPEGYCGMLRGFVLYRAGRSAAADSAFLSAVAQMPAEERCAWNDLGVLLDAEARRAYGQIACGAREAFEARAWQLADPLWREPGNERRAEQYSRKVLVTMLAPLGEDERQRWDPEKGGEAVAESLLRYGWPTQFWWAGFVAENGHDAWLLKTAKVDTAQPYVVREYSRDRLHVMPASRALLSPLQAQASDWTLNLLATNDTWWPREHFARDGGRLIQLGAGQGVLLRRRTGTRFAWAADADTSLWGGRAPRAVHATFFDASVADTVRRLGEFATRARRPVVVDALLPPGPALLGVEAYSDAERPTARTRFSVDVTPPLSALAGAKALSQPTFIDAPTDATMALSADDAIARMLGSTTLRRAGRIGVYWEAYGFSPADTVEITLALSREDKPGLFERVASGFGLWGEEGQRAGVRWTEAPGGAQALTRMEGSTPVQMRSVSLDLRKQRAGRYKLEVSMRTPGGVPVTSERLLSLR